MISTILLFAALTATEVDQFCRQEFGHPGDLGAKVTIKTYLKPSMSYREAVATIGEHGEPDPTSAGATQTYKWPNGDLVLVFENDHLSKYRFGGSPWKNVAAPGPDRNQQAEQLAKKKDEAAAERKRIAESEDFARTVQQAVANGNVAAENDLERSDFQNLKFLLPKYRDAVSNGDWKQADEYKTRMKVSLQRAQGVAADASQRIDERNRAEEERRHREELRQRERQHREEMNKQQEILNELRRRY